MARKVQIGWQENEGELCQMHRQEKDHQNRTRLQALWLLRPGRMMKEVAGLVGVHYRTVKEWVAWYREGGVAGCEVHPFDWTLLGPERRLSEDQEAELKAKAEAGEIRTIQDGVEWAKAQGVDYTYWGMRWVFYRLGLRKKVPVEKHPRPVMKSRTPGKRGGRDKPGRSRLHRPSRSVLGG